MRIHSAGICFNHPPLATTQPLPKQGQKRPQEAGPCNRDRAAGPVSAAWQRRKPEKRYSKCIRCTHRPAEPSAGSATARYHSSCRARQAWSRVQHSTALECAVPSSDAYPAEPPAVTECCTAVAEQHRDSSERGADKTRTKSECHQPWEPPDGPSPPPPPPWRAPLRPRRRRPRDQSQGRSRVAHLDGEADLPVRVRQPVRRRRSSAQSTSSD